MGAGPIGLGHVCLLSFYGLQVAVADMSQPRLDIASRLGAHILIDVAEEDPVTRLSELNDGRGPDYVFDCAGSPQTLDIAMRAVRKGGTVAIVGERGETPIYPSRDIIHRELRIFGSWYFQRHQFYDLVEQVRRGLKPERLITHRFPLEEAAKAYELMEERACGKVVLEQL
ncbi:MAG: zinc-binding dehydrogenase [Armatimonadetes bacterium]|nr:zinc-binding dehydrogenase [Armatimonadota bacterium]